MNFKNLPDGCGSCKYILPDGYNSHCNLTEEICDNLFKRNENCPLLMEYYRKIKSKNEENE